MKVKTSVVLLGCIFAGTASANVTLYGVVDDALGFRNYSIKTSGLANQNTTENIVSQDPGNLMANRWGIKGEEDLSNGTRVGFVLENGFNVDNGQLGYGGRMFGRESQLYVAGPYGQLALGRVGPFVSGNGSYNMLVGMSPYGNQIANYMAGTNAVMSYVGSRIDDSVTYLSPTVSGFQLRFQYSGNVDTVVSGTTDQNKSNVTRYGAVALQYKEGPAYVGLIGDITIYGHKAGTPRPSNGNTITLGGNYNFTTFKVYLAGQYFKNVSNSTFSAGAIKTYQSMLGDLYKSKLSYIKGFGIATGIDIPFGGGTIKMAVDYMNAKSAADHNDFDNNIDFDRWNVMVGYNYDLSKRSTLYTALGYQWDKVKSSELFSAKERDVKFLLGLCHRF